MSRTLLARRLRSLETGGLIEHRGDSYYLTAAGSDLVPVIDLLGRWGQHWATTNLDDADLDPALLMWDIHRRVPVELLPQRRVVVRFQFYEVRKERYWLVLDPDGVDVCYKDPGHPVDLYVTASLRSLVSVWLGHRQYEQARAAGEIELDGLKHLRAALPGWLGLSTFAPLGRAMSGHEFYVSHP